MLEEVLDAWPDMRWNVDVKDPAAVTPFVRAVERTVPMTGCASPRSPTDADEPCCAGSPPPGHLGGRQMVARFRGASALRLSALVARLLREVDCLQMPSRVGRIRLVNRATVDQIRGGPPACTCGP